MTSVLTWFIRKKVSWPSGLGDSLQNYLHRFDSYTDLENACVAQLEEQWSPKPKVVGSIPTMRAKVDWEALHLH